MLDATFLQAVFARGADFDSYLETDPGRAPDWREVYARIALDDAQRALLGAFTRTMHVLVVSGTWCGDCVQQGPMLERIAEASPRIRLRWVDRDREAELSSRIRICGGGRVPTAIFMAEDFEFCALLGDRTLSRYRALARRQLGAACELPWARSGDDESSLVLGEWLAEFERVQLMLRLSPRLRQKHGD
jgi:thiol-disulfide isomerase/thioredoxin